ncbi:MAG: hypothetical protein LBL61_00460 [Elusimicrobiota bacterium]|nr:hypothetical protein [Elusimicrobiota bacterium]
MQKQKQKLGRFFKNHAVWAAALIFFVIFMCLPFLWPEGSLIRELGEKYIAEPLSTFGNPLAAYAKRAKAFYESAAGRKPAAGARGASGGDRDVRRDALSSSDAATYHAAAMAQAEAIRAQQIAQAEAVAESSKEYVRINGGPIYEVYQDESGSKFVKTENGLVPYDQFLGATVSEQDYKAAKKAAPGLEDWQIIEAAKYAERTNYPGGVAQFLQSGDYNRLSGNGARSLFDEAGGRRHSGKGGGFGNFDGFGAPLTADAKAGRGGGGGGSYGGAGAGGSRGVSRGGAGSRAAAGAVAGKVAAANAKEAAKQQKDNTTMLADVKKLFQQQLMGEKFWPAAIKQDKVSGSSMGSGGQSSMSVDESALDNKPQPIQLQGSGENIISGNEDIRRDITKELFCAGKTECSALKTFQGKFDYEDNPKDNPWMFPKDLKGNGPGRAFYNENLGAFGIFLGSDQKRVDKELDDVDKKYKETYGPEIIDILSKAKTSQPLTIAMIDGFKGNDLQGIPDDNYYWQIVKSLVTGKDGKSHAENFSPEGDLNVLLQSNPEKMPIIIIVRTKEQKEYYEKPENGGYIVVEFNGVITPLNLDNFAKELVAATRRFVSTEEAKRKLLQDGMYNAYRSMGAITYNK